MITKTFKLTIATDTKKQMQKEEEHLSMVYGAEEIEALEQTFEWCHDCKEYDQEAHCCHRFCKVIKTTLADIKAEMASEIIEQIEKMRQKEPYYFLPNLDAYNLFQKIVEDYRDGKGAWADKEAEDNG